MLHDRDFPADPFATDSQRMWRVTPVCHCRVPAPVITVIRAPAPSLPLPLRQVIFLDTVCLAA